MNFTKVFLFALKIPKRPSLEINEADLVEVFIKGGGSGGQKVNKTNSKVQLTHKPSGIIVNTQRFRELEGNRKEARKLLALKLDQQVNGSNSILQLRIQKLQKQKRKKESRSDQKYLK